MRALTIDLLYGELMSLPQGQPVTWAELQQRAAEFKPIMLVMAFGQPDAVTRDGLKFTATAAAPATLNRFGATLNSESVVTFEIFKDGQAIEFSKITGVTVSLPIPGLPAFKPNMVRLRAHKEGGFVASTTKFFIPLTMRVRPDGTVSFF